MRELRDVALSILQPWAFLIVNGKKDIENRTWKTDFRGEFYIHAGRNFDYKGYEWLCLHFPAVAILIPNKLEHGGLVGKATLVDCVTQSDSPWFCGPYGFVLWDSQPIQFVPKVGQLGFFHI